MVDIGDVLVYNGSNWQNSTGPSQSPGGTQAPYIFANDPINAGLIETWHAFNPLSASWSVAPNGYAMYRLTAQNELQISAWILSPLSSPVNAVTIATFPEQYVPLSTHGFPVGCDVVATTSTSAPFMTIFGQPAANPGALQSSGIGGNQPSHTVQSNVYIEVKIPLDV